MKRDPYWDSLKFVLICIVVLVHSLGSYKPAGGVNQALYNLLVLFIMPTFTFVSGMFSQINDRQKYKKGILRIFETYVVFQLIRGVTPILVSSDVTLVCIASVITNPRYTLWYLLSLVTWRLMVYLMPENLLREKPVQLITVCFLISLLGGFMPVAESFSLQPTMTFLPFFFMGYYAKNIDVKKSIARVHPLLATGVLLSAFLIIFFIFNFNFNVVLLGNRSYWHHDVFSPFLLCLCRLVFLVSAILLGIMLMRLVMKRLLFPELGKITLFIYIYHSFLIEIVRFAIRNNYLPQNEWICYVIAVVITGVLICLSKVKFFNILLNPVSFFLEKNGSK